MGKVAQPTGLDDLVAGRLPERVIEAVNQVQLSIAEVSDWESSRPVFRLRITERILKLDVRLTVSLKKALALLGGFVGLVWVSMNVLGKFMPLVQELLAKANGTP
jgi:hypothetical protein